MKRNRRKTVKMIMLESKNGRNNAAFMKNVYIILWMPSTLPIFHLMNLTQKTSFIFIMWKDGILRQVMAH